MFGCLCWNGLAPTLIFVWLEELGYEMDVRFTPLVGPTCHSPLSPFPPFFFLQEGASHGAELPPAVCRPLREARRQGAELQPTAARSARRPHPRHGLEPPAASSGAAAGLGVEEGRRGGAGSAAGGLLGVAPSLGVEGARRGGAGSAAAGLGPRRGGGAASALPGSGALLPRRRRGSASPAGASAAWRGQSTAGERGTAWQGPCTAATAGARAAADRGRHWASGPRERRERVGAWAAE